MYVAEAVWKVSKKKTHVTRSLRDLDEYLEWIGRIAHVPGIPGVLIPGGVVGVPLTDTRPVHSTLLIRCKQERMDEGKRRGIR